MTDFGRIVKTTLIYRGKSQRWLAEQIREKTGMFCDDQYISKILLGKVKNEKYENAIKEILEI